MSPYTAQRERTKILIVDDNVDDRFIQTCYLQKAGYQVESVNSAEEALKVMAQGNYYDVALVDRDMPGMRGPQLCAEKRRLGYDLMVLIGMSHYDDQERRDEYLAAGADDFVPKSKFTPEDIAYVIKVIDSAIQYRSQTRLDSNNRITSPELKVPSGALYDLNSNPLLK